MFRQLTAAMSGVIFLAGIATAAKAVDAVRLCEQAVAQGKYLSSDDVVQIAAQTAAQRPIKSEFESTLEFNKRLEKVKTSVEASLQEKVGSPNILIAAKAFNSKYDADRKEMTWAFPRGYVSLSYFPAHGDFSKKFIGLSNTTIPVDSRRAVNAFGATTDVVIQQRTSVGIFLSSSKILNEEPKSSVAFAGVEAATAKQLKETAMLVVVAAPTAPFVEERSSTSPATFSVPYETHYKYVTLAATPLCVALMEANSKTILRMLEPPAPGRRQTAEKPLTASVVNPRGGGTYSVQLISRRSETEAWHALKELQLKFADHLNNRPAYVTKADLFEKGVFYRGLVGPFGTVEEAATLCSSLKAAGGLCVIQRN
jgi:hypothetical protein